MSCFKRLIDLIDLKEEELLKKYKSNRLWGLY